MKLIRRELLAFGLALIPILPAVAFAEAPKCAVCSMKIDHAHRYHFRYQVEGKTIEIGSMSCAKAYWTENKAKKLEFQAMDFVDGKFHDANMGFFLVDSKLKVGNGMDKTSALFFVDRGMAEKAHEANGGRIVGLPQALEAAAR